MSNMIKYDETTKLPAYLQASEDSILDDLASGLEGQGFPTFSIRSSKWRLKMNGEETPLLDKSKNPIPSINFVILGTNQGLSKTYYRTAYNKDADPGAPDCFSMDGTAPDPQAEHPQAKECARCPMNVWGSKITPQGTKTRACSDNKRLAVIMAMDLQRDEPFVGPALLRVPPASLSKGAGSLRSLMQTVKSLNAKIAGVIVKATFDLEADFPKVNFEVYGFLPQELYEKAVELSGSDVVKRITQTMDDVVTDEPVDDDSDAGAVDLPVDEGETQTDEEALGGMFGDDAEEEEPAPKKAAPKKKAAAKKAAPKKKAAAKKAAPPVEEEVSEEEETSGDEEMSFDEAIDDVSDLFS